MSGYSSCACRDCMELAIASDEDDGVVLCGECHDLGCDASGESDCEVPRGLECPGCGCEPGDGRTEGCNDMDGCGYGRLWKRVTFVYTTKSSAALGVPGDEIDVVVASTDTVSQALDFCADRLLLSRSEFEAVVVSMKVEDNS